MCLPLLAGFSQSIGRDVGSQRRLTWLVLGDIPEGCAFTATPSPHSTLACAAARRNYLAHESVRREPGPPDYSRTATPRSDDGLLPLRLSQAIVISKGFEAHKHFKADRQCSERPSELSGLPRSFEKPMAAASPSYRKHDERMHCNQWLAQHVRLGRHCVGQSRPSLYFAVVVCMP